MHTIRLLTVAVSLFFLASVKLAAQSNDINLSHSTSQIIVKGEGSAILNSPPEGLWSIATGWRDNWPSEWKHASIDTVVQNEGWMFVFGKLKLPQGDWHLRDAYIKEGEKIKCVRRYEWKGKQTLEQITLAIRWQVNTTQAKAFLPGILYHGNPSGERNGKNNVAWMHGASGEIALFEEHRYPMPFSSIEWGNGKRNGAALHTIPSPVYGGNHFDQWWSLGVQVNETNTELLALSGPVATNLKRSVAKALQDSLMPYSDTFMKVTPGTIIEKTFYLEVYPAEEKGKGFYQPINTSLGLFKPFSLEGFPEVKEIILSKYKFAKSRWVESANYSGFNMFPSYVKPQIVLGWAGQCEAPGYAMQVLAADIKDETVWKMVQKSLDHITTSPVGPNGFPVVYDLGAKQWSNPDPVSVGQAMNNLALAVRAGRKNKKVNTILWENFLKKSADVLSERVLNNAWNPINTAEAFYISPLLMCYELFKTERYKIAALKAADYYAHRHLSMDEPYWGGTLDATCEDKEGAWGAFQGFMASYESTKDPRYLSYAKHAGYVVLSYTVVWDITLPAGRLADHHFKTRGWTGVSAQNQHLDVFGVLISPTIYKLGVYTKDNSLQQIAKVMYRSCGQLIDPMGSQGEQIQHTNFAQHGDMSNVFKLRGGYSESWTVFWITAHFLNAAAQFKEMGVQF